MLFIIIMTKCLIQRKRSTKYDKDSPKLKQGATGTSTGRRAPRSPRSPGSDEQTPSCRQELSSSSVSKRQDNSLIVVSSSATRTTRTSRCSSPSRRPCGALLQLRRALFVFCTSLPLYQTFFVINVINNIRIRFIISFYVICAMIYCSFCCIYV